MGEKKYDDEEMLAAVMKCAVSTLRNAVRQMPVGASENQILLMLLDRADYLERYEERIPHAPLP